MLDLIWFILLFGSVVLSLWRGEPEAITLALLQEAESAVKLTLGLVGNMAFWLGMLSIAEAAGIVTMLARIMKPVFSFLFPTLPTQDPVAGAILMNLSANMLGLGNAATPLGLKAMQRLQELNPDPSEATAAMCTFLALNTCCITFIPTAVLAARAAAGSSKPAATVSITFLSSAVASIVAVVVDRWCYHLWGRR
ncbi:MAG: spore maturation protein [Firmicutes bacterium]|jgi:spore maturation protein A|nr:spore maturation protein [Bacillota bacterium]